MMGYAISIDSYFDEDSRVRPAMDELRAKTPSGGVNRTDYDALRTRPVAVSIQTKQQGESQIKAERQIGTWQAAQWRSVASCVGDRVATLPFIPSLIVVGDVLKFVASTHKDGKTVWYVGDALVSLLRH